MSVGSDRANSPFRPGYGMPPLVFGGHEREVAELREVFWSYDFGENRSIVLSGLRGAGKTAMLSRLKDEARTAGWLVIGDDASPGVHDRVLHSSLPQLINGLDLGVRRHLAGLGVWHFSADFQVVDDRRVQRPLLRHDLEHLAAVTDNRGVLITIDEVASGRTQRQELGRLALEISHAMSQGVNIMVAFAGIKVDLDALLRESHMTFLRRSRELTFRRLTAQETRFVFTRTAEVGGRGISPEALRLMMRVSQGYPYLVQLMGDYAWRSGEGGAPISVEDAEEARRRAVTAVQERVISRAYDDLSEVDRKFVLAMSQDEERTKIADLVSRLRESDQYIQVYKRRLIDSGYVEADGRGYVRFSLPYLGDYLRAMFSEPVERPDHGGWGEYPPPPMS